MRYFPQVMSRESTHCPPEPMDSEDMLFMLYTSGSTGKPKGIVHTQAGYLLYASTTHQVSTASNEGLMIHVANTFPGGGVMFVSTVLSF